MPNVLSLESCGRTAPSGRDWVKGFRGPGVGGTRIPIGESPVTLEDAEAVTVVASGCRCGLPAPPRVKGWVVDRPNTDSPLTGLEKLNPSREAL